MGKPVVASWAGVNSTTEPPSFATHRLPAELKSSPTGKSRLMAAVADRVTAGVGEPGGGQLGRGELDQRVVIFVRHPQVAGGVEGQAARRQAVGRCRGEGDGRWGRRRRPAGPG